MSLHYQEQEAAQEDAQWRHDADQKRKQMQGF